MLWLYHAVFALQLLPTGYLSRLSPVVEFWRHMTMASRKRNDLLAIVIVITATF